MIHILSVDISGNVAQCLSVGYKPSQEMVDEELSKEYTNQRSRNQEQNYESICEQFKSNENQGFIHHQSPDEFKYIKPLIFKDTFANENGTECSSFYDCNSETRTNELSIQNSTQSQPILKNKKTKGTTRVKNKVQRSKKSCRSSNVPKRKRGRSSQVPVKKNQNVEIKNEIFNYTSVLPEIYVTLLDIVRNSTKKKIMESLLREDEELIMILRNLCKPIDNIRDAMKKFKTFQYLLLVTEIVSFTS